ncbi:MAG: hypothetical protein ACRC80_23430 [Waterburya sp.]
MIWKQSRKLILVLLSFLIVIFLSGTALAQKYENNNDLVRFGGDLTVPQKQVVKDVTAIWGSVTILPEARVTGDAGAIGGDVVLKKGASVDGDAVALGGEVIRAAGTQIGGDMVTGSQEVKNTIYLFRRWGIQGVLARIYLFSAGFHLLAMLAIAILGVLLLLLIPNLLPTIASTINQTPLKSSAWGLGGAIALILLSVLISGSILGILVLPVVNLAALIAGFLGTASMGLLIGQKTLTAPDRKPILQFLVGSLILALIGLIPLIGGLFLLIVNILGFGGVLASQLEMKRQQWFRRKSFPNADVGG